MEPRLRSDDRDFGELVNQILADSQKLVRQELALARLEVQKDWIRGKNALALYAGAAVCYLLAAGLGLIALAFGMRAVGFPLGVAFAILALIVAGSGVASYFLGKRWMQSINLKENVQWLKKKM